MLPGLFPSRVHQTTPTITFLHSTRNATTTATISYGTATPTTPGLLVVTIGSTSATTREITSVSIGGTTGTIHANSGGAGNQRVIASRVVSSGANAISVTYNSTTTTAGGGAGAWLITGYSSTVPVDTGSATVSGATIVSVATTQARNNVGVVQAIETSTVAQTITNATSVASSLIPGVPTFRADWATFTSSVAGTTTVSANGTASVDRRIIVGIWR